MSLVCFCALIVVAVYAGSETSRISSKYLNLSSEDERRSYGFGTTRGWIINNIIFIFGWTYPLTSTPTPTPTPYSNANAVIIVVKDAVLMCACPVSPDRTIWLEHQDIYYVIMSRWLYVITITEVLWLQASGDQDQTEEIIVSSGEPLIVFPLSSAHELQ